MATVYATKLRIGTINKMRKAEGIYSWAKGISAYFYPPLYEYIYNMPDDPSCSISMYLGLDLPNYEWGTHAIEAGITMNGEDFNNPDLRGWYPFMRYGWGDYWKSDIPLPEERSVYKLFLDATDIISGENENSVSFNVWKNDENKKVELFRKSLKNDGSLDCYRVKYVVEVQHGDNPENILFWDPYSDRAMIKWVMYSNGDENYQPLAFPMIQGGIAGVYDGCPEIDYTDENGNLCKCNQSGRQIRHSWPSENAKFFYCESIDCV